MDGVAQSHRHVLFTEHAPADAAPENTGCSLRRRVFASSSETRRGRDLPSPPVSEAPQEIEQAMRADRADLRGLWQRIERARAAGKPHDRNLDRFQEQLAESIRRRADRAADAPVPTYPPELPISQKRDEIAALIRDHPVTVVCGETGSGKSTQLPKILLELGYGVDGVIAHTQPRRIAARTLAQRVADEMDVPLGGAVGYSVRFNDRTGPDTRIRYVTDGLLLSELNQDRDLSRCDAVIIDEAHERSLNIDFLLGYLKRLLPRRPDLKVVITSATIDPQRFAEHFQSTALQPPRQPRRTPEARATHPAPAETTTDRDRRPAPIIEASGRTYPVEVRYRPPGEEGDDNPTDAERDQALLDAADEALRDTDGDVLIFQPTERAIGDAAKLLRAHLERGRRQAPEILPLYSRLSSAEQQKVFNPTGGRRRIVIATNVAESSVTVPNITSVIDTGTARISRFSPRSRMQRLPIEAVSQASANQRAGRCGRVAPGVCIRLFSEDDYKSREPFTAPEILRTNLAAVILRMASMRLGELGDFPFIEPPTPAAVREGQKTLRELHATDDAGALTPLGRELARLPVDPRVGRMLIAGNAHGCAREVAVIAAVLEAQDPRVRPPDQAAAADQAHAVYRDPGSDFATLLNLWEGIHQKKAELSNSAFRRWCGKNFIAYQRLREWMDLHRQLADAARAIRHTPPTAPAEPAGNRRRGRPKRQQPRGTRKSDQPAPPAESLHRALLTGLLSNAAVRTDDGHYQSAGGAKLWLWPGSALAKAKPRWIVAAETVSTTREYARTVAAVDPGWIEDAAGDLVTRTHSEPHWDRDSGQVMAYEKVSLGALTLSPKRRIRLARIDPVAARDLFIHHALVGGDAELTHDFFRHNTALREAVDERQARLRRTDLLADLEQRRRFYDHRLPPEVVGVPELNRFVRDLERGSDTERRLLHMSEADLLTPEALNQPADDPGRPAHLEVAGQKLPLVYRHDPGDAADGVTLQVPLHVLNRLDADTVAWGIPADLEDRITALIRSLPKAVRKTYAPAPDSARRAAALLDFGEGPFLESVARAVGKVGGEVLDPSLFDLSALDDHLRLNLAVTDGTANAETLATGRDLTALKRKLDAKAAEAVAQINDPQWTRDGLTAWTCGPLPEQVQAAAGPDGSQRLTCYPALVDAGDALNLRALDTPARAAAEHPRGVLRLAVLTLGPRAAGSVKHQPAWNALALKAATRGETAALRRQIAEAAVTDVFTPLIGRYPPRDADAFDALLAAGRGDLTDPIAHLTALTAKIFDEAHPLLLQLEELEARTPPGWGPAVAQTRAQLDDLLGDGFLLRTPPEWRVSLPRFLAASRNRLRKLGEGKARRDAQNAADFDRRMSPMMPVWLRRSRASPPTAGPELHRYRWMLEEWRVALFAEELGTSIPVSDKRLDKQANRVNRELASS